MFDKTRAQVKDSFSEAVAMPVKQSFIVSLAAILLAIVALIVAVKH